MRGLALIALLGIGLAGCSGGGEDESSAKGDSVSTVPKMTPEQAAQAANLLPGNKRSGDR